MTVGNLSDRRDFVDVRDVVRAYHLLAEHAQPGEAYNICTNQSVTIQIILDTLIHNAGKSISVHQDQAKLRPSRMPEIRGLNDKIKNQVNWQPQYTLSDSLQDTLTYWMQKISN